LRGALALRSGDFGVYQALPTDEPTESAQILECSPIMELPHPQMTAGTAILALLFYPLLVNLPLNAVRFRWGFSHGLETMPVEVQEKAEATDRIVELIRYVALLAFVIFLLHGSFISTYEAGLTTDNWKSAMALGALLSYVPLSLIEFLKRILPLNKWREEPESRGSVSAWCGLAMAGSVSIELWRALCIAALIRLGLSAWIAVLVLAVVYGGAQLTTSTARAAGAALFGGIAGFLFVKTGSLLAPVTMSLISGGLYLYRVRRISSLCEAMSRNESMRPPRSRYSMRCPACGGDVPTSVVRWGASSFQCPKCREFLAYENKYDGAIWTASVPIALVTMFLLGLRDYYMLFVALAATPIIAFLLLFVVGLVSPPRARLIDAK
jgi:hypothetical protein